MMTNMPKERRAGPGYLWPVAIIMIAGAVAGAFAGNSDGLAETGGQPLPTWAGPVAALVLALAGMALYIRLNREAWAGWSPRKRLYWVTMVASMSLGAGVALTLQVAQGSGDLASDAPLTPATAIIVSAIWVVGMSVASLFYFRAVDDHERHAYYLGSVAGFHAFVIACPVWWVAARASLAPPVDAMALFVLTLAVNLIVYLWFKYR
ncbi:hypothetical protein [Sphingopyxis terrae]|nr:hypothetical protein [Sphingopyxis terrae]